jgi:hypothetical protein
VRLGRRGFLGALAAAIAARKLPAHESAPAPRPHVPPIRSIGWEKAIIRPATAVVRVRAREYPLPLGLYITLDRDGYVVPLESPEGRTGSVIGSVVGTTYWSGGERWADILLQQGIDVVLRDDGRALMVYCDPQASGEHHFYYHRDAGRSQPR